MSATVTTFSPKHLKMVASWKPLQNNFGPSPHSISTARIPHGASLTLASLTRANTCNCLLDLSCRSHRCTHTRCEPKNQGQFSSTFQTILLLGPSQQTRFKTHGLPPRGPSNRLAGLCTAIVSEELTCQFCLQGKYCPVVLSSMEGSCDWVATSPKLVLDSLCFLVRTSALRHNTSS